MTHDVNALGQPIGRLVAPWTSPPFPAPTVMEGRACRVEPLDPEAHAESLYAANALDAGGASKSGIGRSHLSSLCGAIRVQEVIGWPAPPTLTGSVQMASGRRRPPLHVARPST